MRHSIRQNVKGCMCRNDSAKKEEDALVLLFVEFAGKSTNRSAGRKFSINRVHE